MKKTPKLFKALLTIILCFGVFSFSKVFATSIYDQSINNAQIQLPDISNNYAFNSYITGGITGTFSSITYLVKLTPNAGCSGNLQAFGGIAGVQNADSTINVSVDGIQKEITLNYTGGSFSAINNHNIQLNFNNGTGCTTAGVDIVIYGVTGDGTYLKHATSAITGLDTWTAGSNLTPITYFSGAPPPTTNITFDWQNPPFSQNFQSPDFHNWWLCATFPTGHNPAITGYSFKVDYGTSTPYGLSDDLLNTIGVVNINASSTTYTECPLLTKTATSTAGTYKALATLYDQNHSTITQTSILDFTITGDGSVILTTPNNSINTTQSCGNTNFVVLSVDFGKGFCELTRFLFVPSDSTLQNWTNSKDLMAQRAPFSYFYDLTGALSHLSTTTNATITPLTLNVATGTPMQMSIDIFSVNTLNRYTDTNSRNIIRTLIKYALYLSFIAMIILEVRHLFKKK